MYSRRICIRPRTFRRFSLPRVQNVPRRSIVSIKDLQSDEKIMQYRILDLLKNREDERGLKLFHQYKQFQTPSLYLYSQILHQLMGRESVVQIIREMLQERIQPDKAIYQYLFKLFSSQKLVSELIPLMKEFPKILNDPLLWDELLPIFLNTQDLSGFKDFIEQIDQNHLLSHQEFSQHLKNQTPSDIFLKPPPTHLVSNPQVFEKITSCLFSLSLTKEDKKELDYSVFTLQTLHRLQYDHFKEFLIHLAKKHDMEGLKDCLSAIHTNSYGSLSDSQIISLSNLYLSQLNLHGNQTSSSELLQIIIGWSSEGFKVDQSTFLQLISIASKERKIRLLPVFHRLMKELKIVPNTDIALLTVRSYLESKKLLNALKTVDEMIYLNVPLTKPVFTEIANYFKQNKNFSQTQKYLLLARQAP